MRAKHRQDVNVPGPLVVVKRDREPRHDPDVEIWQGE